MQIRELLAKRVDVADVLFEGRARDVEQAVTTGLDSGEQVKAGGKEDV